MRHATASWGGRRPENQDHAASATLPGGGICAVVADGIAGLAKGRETAMAAAMAVMKAARLLPEGVVPDRRWWVDVLDQANREIGSWEEYGGCALSAAVAKDGNVSFGHVGDTRITAVGKDGQAVRLTTDMNIAGALWKGGHIDEADYLVHPMAHQLLAQLSPTAPMDWDDGFESGVVRTDGLARLVLTSDGIHGTLAQADILSALPAGISFPDDLDPVLEKALSAGGRDNMSLAVIEL